MCLRQIKKNHIFPRSGPAFGCQPAFKSNKMISTSKRHAEHQGAGLYTQQINKKLLIIILKNDK